MAWLLTAGDNPRGATAWRYWCGEVPLSAERSDRANSSLTAAHGHSCGRSSKGHPVLTVQPSMNTVPAISPLGGGCRVLVTVRGKAKIAVAKGTSARLCLRCQH
ncbi:unnamed protein product [Pleuronectes platessa]|uniref:Uncharacterized protein n=1 Tax=Pleuronectes platessa TaxID=8262 RepID=A0A9N7UH35_PLEPL|nr:unnamed protein product [Pleuronectes platessa]